MKLSVITVNYNNVEGLRRTIDSVYAQTCHNYEYIIIDGNSTDGSKELINKSQSLFEHAVFVSEPDGGIYNAMNKGVKLSTGDYCIFMNSGDSFYDSASLTNSLPYLQDYDIISGVATRPNKEVMSPPLEGDLNLTFFLRNSLNHQSTFIKRELLLSHPYNEDYKIVSDTEFFFFSLIMQNASYLPIPVLVADCEQAGESGDLDASLNERFVAISSYFPQRMVDDLLYLKDYNIWLMRKIGSILKNPLFLKLYRLCK